MSEFMKGQTVYLDDGRVCQYLGEIDGQLAVSPAYREFSYAEDDDPDNQSVGRYFTGVMLVDNVYPEAPSVVKDAEIEAKNEQIRELSKLIEEARLRLHNEARKNAQIFEQLASYAGLENVKRILDGEFTHVVVHSMGREGAEPYEVIDRGTFMKSGHRKRVFTFTFESVFGKFLGKVHNWTSGGYYDCPMAFCFSEEEAAVERGKMAESDLLKTWERDFKNRDPGKRHEYDYQVRDLRNALARVEKFHAGKSDLAQEVVAWLAVYDDAVAERAAAEKRANLAALKAELEQAE